MPRHRHLCRVLICATLATRFSVADTHDPIEEHAAIPSIAEDLPSSWLNQLLTPLFRFFVPATLTVSELLPDPVFEPSIPPCAVQPLPAIQDTEAMSFESNVGPPAVVNLDGLTPTTARALARFEHIVTSAGGAVAITSAYRPLTYQEHLQAVWDKWMVELRDNTDENCQSLKAEVAEEFTRHQLLTTQRPVPISDHTLGIGFDASVQLPFSKRYRRRKLNLDVLARKAGFQRPSVARDPVHFRLIGARG